MTKSQILHFVDSSHFRSFEKAYEACKRKFPDVQKKDLRKWISEKWHDHTTPNKLYMVKVFSTRPNCWQMDLMDNGQQGSSNPGTQCLSPRYWYVFINVNTRYADAFPLQSKRGDEIREVLSEFVDKYKPIKITSDQEAGINSQITQDFLENKKVSIQIVTEQNHSTLSIVDRFIRTLRDMNTPSDKSKHESSHEKYTFISPKRMQKFLDSYNSSYHTSINCTPEEMQNDPELEREYIFKCLEQKERQAGMKDMILNKGDYVFYLIPRNTLKKRRYYTSRECYRIAEIKGNIYTIIAKDGNVKNLPRYRLIRCNPDGSKPPHIKFASTFPGNWNGLIQSVIGYNTHSNRYRVIFTLPDNEKGYADVIPPSYLSKQDRQDVPTVTGSDSKWKSSYNS